MDLLSTLNQSQRDAVTYGEGPMLVLAGAGSGKTRVLTHRIAHLISHFKIDPMAIFAVTFTNKAAAEMRTRSMDLLRHFFADELALSGLWIGTFHSSCVRILRSDIHHLGYQNQFTIYDDGDQRSVIKACMKEQNVSESAISSKMIQARINKIKNDGKDHTNYQSTYGGPVEDAFVRVFERYGEVLQLASALDFADLILKTVQLFEQFPNVLKNYQERFQHLLIDEYQDTNRCQYRLMRLLAGPHANICAVGDEDQSIYRWRGADISNILNFEEDYPNAKIFKLEQNYRSTKTIIEAASKVISFNAERREKTLWTENIQGEPIELIEAYDEHDESQKVGNEIANCLSKGHSLGDIAVFYRTNAQSRLLEDMLRAKGINYQIYGGLKFYDRLEVKDALAYMKLLCNSADDVSFRRIINVPTRGIGAVSLNKLATQAKELGVSYYQLLKDAFGPHPKVTLDVGRAAKKFESFYRLMATFEEEKDRILPSNLLDTVLDDTGYRQKLTEEHTVEAQTRLENLAELRQSLVEYELRCGAEKPKEPIQVEGFLEQIALVSDIDRFDADAPALKMMTIHMAKGLEFNVVLIVGLEEELFPNIRPWEGEDDANIEEERRLFYVGMTRARQKLFLLYAKNRTVFGTQGFRVMSRFIEEIPGEYLNYKKADYFTRRRPYVDRPGLPRARISSPQDVDPDFNQDTACDDDYFQDSDPEENVSPRRGSRVVHPTFGEGVVRQMIGRNKLLVSFPGQGVKKISLKFTQLKTLS